MSCGCGVYVVGAINFCARDIEQTYQQNRAAIKGAAERGSNNKNEKVPCRWSVIFARVATYFVGEPRVLISTSDTEDLQKSTRSSNRELSKAQADSPAQLLPTVFSIVFC